MILAAASPQKFKESAKGGFLRKMTYFFGVHGLKIGRGGYFYLSFVHIYQKPSNVANDRVLLPTLGLSCRKVLHTSVPAYRGCSPEIPLFFGFSGLKIGIAASLPTELSPKPSNPGIRPILGNFCLLWDGTAEQGCTPVYLPIGTKKPTNQVLYQKRPKETSFFNYTPRK